MSTTELDTANLRLLVTSTILAPSFRRATFAGAARLATPSPWVRVVVQPVQLRSKPYLQFSYFDEKKNITKNGLADEIAPWLNEILDAGYAGIHLSTTGEEVDIRTSKKGKIHIGRRKAASPTTEIRTSHNRTKSVPLPEGQSNHLLEAMGILTRTGQVRPTMRAKFTQINECLKLLGHVLDDAGLRSLPRDVEILDCGCGSSYLTLAVHHYLKEILDIPARVIGVDVNEEVIRKSIERALPFGADTLAFRCARIASIDIRPDIVLALHACDTATDDAMALAIASKSRILLSVPCCHHHLNDQLRAEGPAQLLRPILRHGILHQRTADLLTDAFRALALRIMGYQTDVIEFISPEHTARNLMIRAVSGLPIGELGFVREYHEMRRFWGVVPYIETALGEPFARILNAG